MGFNRDALPEPLGYFEAQGLQFRERRGRWRTTRCDFHGGSDSLRVNVQTGAFVCMSCGASGGDVLAFEMQLTGTDFVSAAKTLGAWIEDGKPVIYRIDVRLRYRQENSKVAFWYELIRPDKVLKAATEAEISTIRTHTNLPVMFGHPN